MFFGLDLGGSKLEYRVFSDEWQTVSVHRTSVAGLSYMDTLLTISNAINHMRYQYGQEQSIGLATPGSVDQLTGRIKNAPSSAINGCDLSTDIESLVNTSVFIFNDANAFVFSEAFDGAAQGYPIVFGAILGTGVGGALVINGELLHGANRIAGEWGHNPFPFFDFNDYPEFSGFVFNCPCGELNHTEAFLSGYGLEEIYRQASGIYLKSEEIIAKYRISDYLASRVFNFYLHALANALASVVNILDPDVIVFGGGLSKVKEIYTILPLIEKYSFSDNLKTRLVPPKYGDASGAKGAAQLAWKIKTSTAF